MKLSKIKYLGVLALVVIPLFMLGCSSPQEKKTTNVAEDIKLNSGAILKFEDGNYKLYNYQNQKYSPVKNNYSISSYDKSSSTYVYTDGGKNYIVRDNKEYEIKDSNYSSLKLSKGGEYISYFIDDNGLKLKVFNTNGNKPMEIKSNVSISGVLYDWYDSNTLIYYGVSNDGVNGLFTYNIKEDKEELLYNIKEGFLAFLKGTDDNVVFLQISLENKKQLIMIDKKSKDIKLLTDKVLELTDIVMNNGNLYFTGKASNNINSLYELINNTPKRLVYDFPTVVKIDKGLRVDENGNIIFIGSDGGDTAEEQIYTYTQDGSISAIAKNSTDYVFLEYIN
ncbi:hypothetical protein [Clostridium sp.]|uniref:hypothetical protein n=1 Tax=Clostridium sp. TaxID=1506 RepID=UPI00283B0DB1|nr:hypothetical protein [Clostridium sp.]MDR3595819.1 hypothetical protein [Clostridium sp.]